VTARPQRPSVNRTVMCGAAATPGRGSCASTRPGFPSVKRTTVPEAFTAPSFFRARRRSEPYDLRNDAVHRVRHHEHHAVVGRERPLPRELRHHEAEPLPGLRPACRRTRR
jgi:hypothetical protein